MKDCKGIKSPLLSEVKIEEAQSTPLENNTLYKQLVGCLLYLTHTRPDISYVVSVASRHMDHPHDIHLRAVKRILNFIQGTKTHGVHYAAQSSLELVGFTNSNWEGDNTNRKSNYRYVSMLVYGPIIWSSKNKSVIALSSTSIKTYPKFYFLSLL